MTKRDESICSSFLPGAGAKFGHLYCTRVGHGHAWTAGQGEEVPPPSPRRTGSGGSLAHRHDSTISANYSPLTYS